MTVGSDWKLRTSLSLAFLVLIFASACSRASAQAVYTADRTPDRIYVFVEGTDLAPDYGATRNIGYTLGAGYTKHFDFLNASVEGRVTQADGEHVGETSYMGGLKGSRAYGRFHPYGEFLLGYGRISFYHPPSPYYHDNSTVFGAGAGLDYDVVGNFAVKGEFDYQSWKLGNSSSRLTPTMFSVGVAYHFPFGRR